MTMTIIDPTISSAPSRRAGRAQRAPRPSGLDGLRVGLLENTKRNAAVILDALGQGLVEQHGVASLVRRTKKQFALPLSDELLDDLRANCDVVVIGVGDCGSCSAAAVADGIALEAAGVPTAVICTDAFEATSRAMADIKGDPDYPFVLTAHPVANLSRPEIDVRAGELLDAAVQRVTLRREAVA